MEAARLAEGKKIRPVDKAKLAKMVCFITGSNNESRNEIHGQPDLVELRSEHP